MTKKNVLKGIAFQCEGCAACCKSGSAIGYVYLTLRECTAIARYLTMSKKAFMNEFIRKGRKRYHFKKLRGNCPFLKKNQCTIYQVRPLQCQTWPFWPENIDEEVWRSDVIPVCPGIGKGKVYSVSHIKRIVKRKR